MAPAECPDCLPVTAGDGDGDPVPYLNLFHDGRPLADVTDREMAEATYLYVAQIAATINQIGGVAGSLAGGGLGGVLAGLLGRS
jgi:hypothetical protein